MSTSDSLGKRVGVFVRAALKAERFGKKAMRWPRLFAILSSCVIVIFIHILVLAQPSRTPLGNQPNRLLNAREPHAGGASPNLPRMPGGLSLAQRRAGVSNVTLPLSSKHRLPTPYDAPALTDPAGQDPGPIFTQALTYLSGGETASSVAMADLNGDGLPDLVVANQCASSSTCSNGTVGVLLGNGDGTFQPVVSYSSGGANPISVVVADLDGDGHPDIIVVNQNPNQVSSTLGVLFGDGSGNFSPAVTFNSGGGSSNSVVVADINKDGMPDLIVANQCPDGTSSSCSTGDGTVSVLLNQGTRTFGPAATYTSGGSGANAIAVADLKGNGNLDVVVANKNSNSVSVLLNNGDGTFPSPSPFASGGYAPLSIAIADINGDGKPDLVVANQCTAPGVSCNETSPSGSLSVFLGNGDGTFTLTNSYPAPVTGPVVTFDLNGDHNLDLVVGGGCSTCGNSGLVVFLGNGDGTFKFSTNYSSGGYSAVSLAVGDVNGDKKPDIAVANACITGGDCSSGNVGVLLGNGDGTFRGALIYPVAGSGFASSAAVADLNDDGKLDLVFADMYGPTGTSGGALVFLGNGNGTFNAGKFYAFGGTATDSNSVVVADINNDGIPDLVGANLCNSASCPGEGSVAVLLGNGDGTFKLAQTYDSGGSGASAIAVASLKGDAYQDVVVANENSYSVCVLLNDRQGAGTLQPANCFPSGGYAPVSIALADINGDNIPDLLVSNYCNISDCLTNGLISVRLGDGKGGFGSLASYSTGGNRAGPLVVADVNGDHYLDVVVYNICQVGSCVQGQGNGVLSVLLGNGHGTFQDPIKTSAPGTRSGIGWQLRVADFNGDGALDVASGLPGALWFGNGDGTFQTAINLGAWGAGSAVGDFNGDGRLDLAVGGGNVVILLNKTLGSASTSLISSNNPSNFGQSVTFTATVTSQGFKQTPTGTVTFTDGSATLGSVSLTNGMVSLSTSSLTAGIHSITASYSGDSNFASSSSAPLPETVNQATSVTGVSSSPNPSYLGQAVTLLATVTPQYGGSATGTVTFYDGTNALGSVNLSSNTASLVLITLAAGLHTITANYGGDGNVLGSVSAPISETVLIQTFPLQLSSVGTGSGVVTDSPGGQIYCTDTAGALSGTCSGSYVSGTPVILTASATLPSAFAGWGGACASSGTNPTCSLTMNSALNVTADFVPPPTSVTLPFNTGTNVTEMATFCPNHSSPCTDPNAHALTLAIPLVSSSFSLTVTATEYQADGLCPPGGNGRSSDLDCRLVSFFNYGTDAHGNTIVPLCYPYSNGNCVHYQVYSGTPGAEPNPNSYSGGVFWKIGFNNSTFSPTSYWANSTPRLLDDPDANEVPGLPYGTLCNTPMLVNGVPTNPLIYCQYDRDITTFWNPASGLDSTIGGRTKQTNDVLVVFPPTTTGSNPVQQVPTPSAPTLTGSCVNGCTSDGSSITFTVGTGGAFAVTPTGFPTPTLTQSGTLPNGLTFNPITGLLSGTPAAGTSGTYPFSVNATNIAGSATLPITLEVSNLGLSTTSVNFGTLHLGQIAVQPVTLTNTGKTPITISSIKVTGPGNAVGDYGDITLCTPLLSRLPGTLPPGKSCKIFVGTFAALKIFSPMASTATLAITDSTPGSPHWVSLTAQVINPLPTFSTYKLMFPAQTVGTTSGPKTVTLKNTGNTPLTLGTLSVSGNFSLAASTTCSNGSTLATGASCAINVTFTPTAKGTRAGSIKITDNAMISPQIIWLSGAGN